MGDAAAADEGLIPPVVGSDHPDYRFAHGQLDYAAEARLINDNLLDLSHVSFLHAESFRVSETWAREHPRVTEHERSIRLERWIRGEGPMASVDTEERVDTYFCHDHFVPGVLLMAVRTYPLGTADALNRQQPDINQAAENFAIEAVTPLTDKTTRYFYMMGLHRRHFDEAAGDTNMAAVKKAFDEDKAMIEAQQRNIDLAPGQRFVATTADRGAVLFNRLVEKLTREESAR